jgi:hypothetical protein
MAAERRGDVKATRTAADRWLRFGWVVVAVLYALPFLVGLPLMIEQYGALTGPALQTGFQNWTTEALRSALAAAGVSIGTWAAIRLATDLTSVLGAAAIGLLIFTRVGSDRFGLFSSLFLWTFGLVSSGTSDALSTAYPQLRGPLTIWVSLPWLAFYVFFYTFPSGQFVPRWMKVWTPIFLLGMISTFLFSTRVANALGLPLILVAFGSAVFSQVYRYRRVSNPVERAQTKWVTFAIAVIGVGEVVGQGVVPALFPMLVADPVLRLRYGLGLVLAVPVFLLIPLAVAIAVLRHRLWDIDVVIRRTLIYSALSAVLALAYLGSVLVLESIFRALTGQGQNSLVVVLSTLAIAALFGPVRSRVQHVIDQRFYRRKYDAARTLSEFGTALRDETDLARLSERLVGAVDETMQPASVGLWLRPGTQQKSGRGLA